MMVRDSERNLSAANNKLNLANVIHSQAETICVVYDAIIERSLKISDILARMNMLFRKSIKETNRVIEQNGYKINFGHSIYLPGIDEHTYKLDGSVRVYFKVTVSRENSVELSAYRTVNFKNGKISGIWEWADYGGLINQLDRGNK